MADLDAVRAGGSSGAMSRAAQLAALSASNAAQRAATLRKRAPVPPRRPSNNADLKENRPGVNPPPPIMPPNPVAVTMEERNSRFADWRENRPEVTGIQAETGNRSGHLKRMVDDIMQDPIADPMRLEIARELSEDFGKRNRFRFFTADELVDNPLVRTVSDLSAWSRYRRMVADWNSRKAKTGEAADGGEGGDGTYGAAIDEGSFATGKSASALPPYVVARDENGLLQVIRAEQWYQGRFTEMRKDPRYAAQIMTALAATSLYGTDATANNQRSRLVTDRDGNPVKAIPGVEDLNALASLANQAVIWQVNGDETAIDDVLAQLYQEAKAITDVNVAKGETGGDSGGGRRGGGYGGGGGGGTAAVRFTDPTELSATIDSIARQRMGRSLSPEEASRFVSHFHQLEAQNSAAYYSGQSFTQLDPQGQAVAWIQANFLDQAQSQQYGNLAARFVQMMGSGNPFGVIS